MVQNYWREYFNTIDSFIKTYSGYHVYILDMQAYLVKLQLGLDISKYDLINDGNMGYRGSYKYIDEIDNYCKNNDCIFFIDSMDFILGNGQTNQDIINYFSSNNYKIFSSNTVNVYVNKLK